MIPSKTYQLSLIPYRVGGGVSDGCVRGVTAFSFPSSGREILTLRRENTRRIRCLTHVLRRIVNHAN